jgi:hypothetical protein
MMKHIQIAAIAFDLAILAHAGTAQAETARDLYNYYREPANSEGRDDCLGYIAGVVDALIDLHRLPEDPLRVPFNPTLYSAWYTCFGHLDAEVARPEGLFSIGGTRRQKRRSDARSGSPKNGPT